MKRITIMSRQSDEPSLDIRMLEEALKDSGEFKVRVMCKKLRKSDPAYAFHMLSQLMELRRADVLIVDGYCIVNSMFRHPAKLKTVQMWHALSAIKKFGWQTVGHEDGSSERVARVMKMHRGYDYVLSSSDITARFFCEGFRTEPEKIVKLALPRVDYLLNEVPGKAKEILGAYPELEGRRIMLYVPTFRKGRTVDTESLRAACVKRGFTLVVKLHPLDRTEAGEGDGIIIDRQFNSYDWLSICDAVVSDYSSYVVEASLAERPLYLYTYDKDEYADRTGLNVDFAEEAIGRYEYKDAEELAEAAAGEEYDYEALRQFRDRYIDVDRNDCTGQIVKFIREITKG